MSTLFDISPRAAPPPPDTRPVVLCVEDHPVNVMLMEAMLNHRPHLRLVVATTGEEGLQAAEIEQPDLLLLDYDLPDCNGVELLSQLRLLDGLGDVPAVAFSASEGAATEVKASSFCAHWPKPFDVEEALALFDRLIDHPPGLATRQKPVTESHVR
jgi:CheY-like chemotaxis protein